MTLSVTGAPSRPHTSRPHSEPPASSGGTLLYITFISAVAAIGGFLFGFDSGVINGTVTALSKAFQSDSVATGFNVASVIGLCAGCFIGRASRGPIWAQTGDADHSAGVCHQRLGLR